VQVADVPIDADRRHVERDRTGRMRRVGEHRDTTRTAARRDLGERKDERARRRDVIDDCEPRARPDSLDDRVRDLCGIAQRVWDLDRAHGRLVRTRNVRRGVRDRAVRVIRDEDLVAWPQIERAQHRVHAGRGVVHEHEIVTARAKELGHRERCHAHAWRLIAASADDDLGQLAQHEARRLALDLVTDLLLSREHALRRRADRAVIQVEDLGIESELLQHRVPEARRCHYVPHSFVSRARVSVTATAQICSISASLRAKRPPKLPSPRYSRVSRGSIV
jgi:hypothetical protein